MYPETIERMIRGTNLVWEYRQLFADGLVVNLKVWVLAAALSTTLSVIVCAARLSRWRAVSVIAATYTELVRNTPEYIMLIWIHYVPLVVLGRLLDQQFAPNPLVSCVLALGLCSSGYLSETLRAGIVSIPHGQREAGRSLGLSDHSISLRIIYPQALRNVAPDIFNLAISLFKGTTLVSLVAVPDLMYQAAQINAHEMWPVPVYTAAALVFSSVVILASFALHAFASRHRKWAT